MTVRDYTRRGQHKTILQLLVLSAYTIRYAHTYSSGLLPRDFQLFLALRKNFVGRRFGSNAEVTQAVKRFFCMQSPEFFLEGF
ncbi:hypothetical protein TNCV_4556231 [Trichonephila clavipes]|nr:hypothetical protein TNCV_4556231 [Trichonephila clavipes]